MNELLKNLGIIFVIAGVAVIGIYALNTPVSNTTLIISGALAIGGVALHVILNRILD